MSDTTTNLLLPYILAAQGQKHVTHNEALRILDGLVQLSVLDRDLTAPPGSPADGDRYIVASGGTGDWAGWDLNVALFTDGAWLRLPPRTGWRAWVEDEGLLLVYDGAGWIGFALLTLDDDKFRQSNLQLSMAADLRPAHHDAFVIFLNGDVMGRERGSQFGLCAVPTMQEQFPHDHRLVDVRHRHGISEELKEFSFAHIISIAE
ncbi:DUF2793 domain-containing protein [Tritonibacter horizontis]|uniref:DUF2793 domain-containing protein n=1 Tax=Tritonibacter horizontis TaxID=1768241 RepID=A0A132BQF0_9RHOB|nr:DUF2793 domain-containing protein [Tritonibacter horizontis]KUP90574.1 hypothetical protein TRIHO_44390 [Tritonibacter horizontis]